MKKDNTKGNNEQIKLAREKLKLKERQLNTDAQIKLAREKLNLKERKAELKKQNKSQIRKDLEERIGTGVKKTPWGKIFLIWLIVGLLLATVLSILIMPSMLQQGEDAEKAKCESIDGGIYGGSACYVNGERQL